MKQRLDRFYARIRDGEVLDDKEMEEGKRMEKLLGRWLICVEEDVAREEEDKKRCRHGGGLLSWLF